MLIKNHYCIRERGREGGEEDTDINDIMMKHYLKLLINVLYSLREKKCNKDIGTSPR